MIVELKLHPNRADEVGQRAAVAKLLDVAPERITHLALKHRAIDARHRNVWIRLKVEVTLDVPPPPVAPLEVPELPVLTGTPEVVIVGAGPAGLYAAWGLALRGVRSVLLDRGRAVRGRRADLARLNREGVLDTDSNYCFGEGGAGTFSDGKLYTRATKRGPVREALELLVACGAPERILTDARPHIGTNRLPKVIGALRERLEAAGVEVRFEARVDDLLLDGQTIKGVRLADGTTIPARAVVLAAGHSARDVYRMLERRGVHQEAKAFALGVRVEHPQRVIDEIQYGRLAGHAQLGAAPYTLKRTIDKIGVYSFCMCPGGFIVAAATERDGVVVNGMSPSTRDSKYANSGVVVTLGPEVFGEGALAGLDYQAAVERAAFVAGGGKFKAPAQRLTDFLSRRISQDLPECSYRPGLESTDLMAVLPPRIGGPLRDALRFFDAQKMRGYATREAVIVGVESRSSAPVRVPRDPQTLESVSTPGLYPCGEGAGYAGGIISAALDGLRVAERVAQA